MEEKKMRAVQIHAPGEFSVDWVPVPKPGHGEVLVEVKAVAICGSDPGIFNGKVLQNGWPPYFPFIAGHEFADRRIGFPADRIPVYRFKDVFYKEALVKGE